MLDCEGMLKGLHIKVALTPLSSYILSLIIVLQSLYSSLVTILCQPICGS
jgi:hypothetical protein